ncbi:hypothetical protein GCM10023353_15170 [Tomitella cavernea]|uniref:Uncharacterized protein n=1 Tax=Tomitella cavernea TaxID=1387982 RepID=A0ABP9CLV8_9ACTN
MVFDAKKYIWFEPPAVGDQVRWQLWWTEEWNRYWAGLRPGWRLTTELRASSRAPKTYLDPDSPAGTVIKQSAIAICGDLRAKYVAPIPIPDSLTMSGALTVNATEKRRPARAPDAPEMDPETITVGTVTGLQVVSVLHDWGAVDRHGWSGFEPIAGNEWFYDVVRAPARLHHYRPSDPDSSAVRNEVLLVDLDVSDASG